ncbi:1-phosphofructokinase family hexose kinase [Agromyces bracchium]|uniref:Hexose kinase n=1 Tax=Agromyces bracchium TaxID=88376 RepID=A0A6I3M6Q0_9MICO|nr:1-phosphofructokinase family hexose kinase [Agromyces bracchium]MTH67842.1 hexose kinase [Agromyces bracchium]
MAVHAPIVTLTMNPALDVSSTADRVVPEHKLRCGPSRFDPGGGGVNVSRAIRNLGGSSIAVYPLGGPTGQAYRGFIEEAGLVARVITIGGNTRESFTVDELSTGEQYRFVLQGPMMREPEWRACLSVVADELPVGGFLVASGSLPPGVPDGFYALLAEISADHDVRLVVDASGPALAAALEAGVFLIKPSRDELAELVGAEGELDESAMVDAARSLVTAGRSEVVALTLGARGAILVTSDEVLRLPTPRVEVASAVGAGDAFLGALVLRLAQGRTLPEAFRTAVAAGSATAMLPATELCRASDVARLEADLAVA